jgi:hypothetical protein
MEIISSLSLVAIINSSVQVIMKFVWRERRWAGIFTRIMFTTFGVYISKSEAAINLIPAGKKTRLALEIRDD